MNIDQLKLKLVLFNAFINVPVADLLSPTKTNRRAKIAGLTEREGGIPHPWASLYRLLYLVGQKLGWEMSAEFFEKSR